MICVEKEKNHKKMENKWIYKLFLLKVWTILYSGRDTRVTKDNTKQTRDNTKTLYYSGPDSIITKIKQLTFLLKYYLRMINLNLENQVNMVSTRETYE